MYVGDDYGKAFARSPAKASRYMEYWQKNAAYIKNNIDKLIAQATKVKKPNKVLKKTIKSI